MRKCILCINEYNCEWYLKFLSNLINLLCEYYITYFKDSNREYIGRTQAIKIVTSALRRHILNPEICKGGCKVFLNFAANNRKPTTIKYRNTIKNKYCKYIKTLE